MNIIEVSLISYPEEAELIANIAAVICYSEEAELERVKQKAKLKKEEYLCKIIESGHLSIIEHNIFVFHVSGVSRVLSHQLVRKRIASYSQQSQRYVNASSFSFITPKTITESGMKEEYENKINELFVFYNKLVEKGIPKEDARYILPNSTSTQLVVSMNAHALIDFFASRCCTRAQWEIRELANKMLNEVKKVAPVLFKKAGAFCDFYGYCPENEKTCGRAPTLEQLKKYWEQDLK
ncbi:MAG: FAD-dependent thymidylate synthase [Candidatus Heimdallarchaeum endolithica]|uniref:Flavin-dependent thymidylate synthase n=1 Tax=Candidatus Heimdallarchaeum endolithica TaxID=2876572 RepID=A0A9Y1BPT7_9ARCH|nr:MAG: FAD-dependent thymidylate synthase [Candidatus Heimdallarchaeum endolithica]